MLCEQAAALQTLETPAKGVFLCRQAAAWTAGVAWRRRWGAAKTFDSDMNAMSFVIGRRRPGQLTRAVGGAGGFFIVSTTLKAIELLSNRHPLCLAGGGLGSWRGLAAALGERLFMGLDASQLYADALMGELAAEVENGRLLRLVSRLSAVTERPEHEGDPQWSETGAPAASPCCLKGAVVADALCPSGFLETRGQAALCSPRGACQWLNYLLVAHLFARQPYPRHSSPVACQ